MRSIPRRLAALILIAISVLGGPGLAALEAFEHADRSTPGHGYQSHLELPGGQDHDDGCGSWLAPGSARVPALPPHGLRVPDADRGRGCAAPVLAGRAGVSLLPRSRAPPVPL